MTDHGILRKCRTLTNDQVASKLAGARLLEEDGHGPKVYRTADGEVLKLFRVKQVLSSNLWNPYAKRFVSRALGLRRRGIDTVDVLEWGRAPHIARQYVRYRFLEGRPVRDVMAAMPGCPESMAKLRDRLADFLGLLHEEGIFFRSCHLGNILVLSASKRLALIDVMDLTFRDRPLRVSQRRRNFRHFLRYPADRRFLKTAGWDDFLDRYWKACPSVPARKRFDGSMESLCPQKAKKRSS